MTPITPIYINYSFIEHVIYAKKKIGNNDSELFMFLLRNERRGL